LAEINKDKFSIKKINKQLGKKKPQKNKSNEA